ncbi:PAS domain-containing protein [Geobacillus zalihae]|uniref:PAS domain-containing protein n=1 Tax=Geobacillus zalihae TaxID=213419 RepID=UPI0016800332|nr:PAS domain-containing protein [Geobacillus zalihae]QNU25934.1 PAS domain-containing protein [Geobacillus zalihae]
MDQYQNRWTKRSKLDSLFYDGDGKQLDFEKIFYFLDHSYEGLVLTDRDGRIIYANHAVERISGVPLREMIGFSIKELERKGIIIYQSIKVLKKIPLLSLRS